MTDHITIDVPTDEDWDALYDSIATAFNEDADEATASAERLIFEPGRALVARRDGRIVGTAGIYSRRLAIPGGVVPAAHVTLVTVAPTARRQGVLTRFMRRQFDDIRAAGESLAILWASEGRIYQRFGYGLATRQLAVAAETREVTLTTPQSITAPPPATTVRSAAPARPSPGLREASPADVRDELMRVYDQVYPRRPGWSDRAWLHWEFRLIDHEVRRRGFTKLRAVTHEGDHGIDGYALWRVSGSWEHNGPTGEVRIVEVVAASGEAYAALWRFLLSVDLTRTVTHWTCALDEPIQFMVNEPRRLNARLHDGLWLRIVNLPRALAERRYADEIEVVLEVTDDLIPANAGRWRLKGSTESASCESTVDDPDIRCDIRALGAAYLGGTSLVGLAGAGLVTELHPATLARASTAFGWHVAPSAVEVF